MSDLCRGFVEAVAAGALSHWAPEHGLPEWDVSGLKPGDDSQEVSASLYEYHRTVAQALHAQLTSEESPGLECKSKHPRR